MNQPLKMNLDHQAVLEKELSEIQSLTDFCKSWKDSWRGIALAAQGILKVLFPTGATVLGYLIAIADSFCSAK